MALDSEGVHERDSLRQLVRKWASDYCREWFQDQSTRFEYSLAHRCWVQLGDAAIADGIDDEHVLADILHIVTGMREAADPQRKGDADFWRHDALASSPKHIREMGRFELEAAVDQYLRFPARSSLVDRTLVDMLIALEFHAYKNEVYGDYAHIHGFAKGNGPIGFLGWRLASLLLFGIPAAILVYSVTAEWIDGEWPLVVAAVLAGLFFLESLWAVIVFPFAWRRQIVRNKKIVQLLTDMNGVYSEMSSSGPISARHIRERAQDVSVRGVVWPAPLFALLDDIIARTARM